MDRIRELVGRITELSDDELNELRDLVLAEFDAAPAEGEGEDAPIAIGFAVLEELAEASDAVRAEQTRRTDERDRRTAAAARLRDFRSAATPVPAVVPPAAPPAVTPPAAPPAAPPAPPVETPPVEPVVAATGDGQPPSGDQVPPGREPQPVARRGALTVVRAGADLPGFQMGAELRNRDDVARAMTRRVDTMRGIRGGDGDKLIVVTATLEGVPEDRHLTVSDAEGNLRKVSAIASPQAIVAAGGLGAPEETRYDLFETIGVTDRPVRDMLPVFTTERGGVRFMRSPTLNDVNGVVGIWTVQNDIDAVTNPAIRKPSFRVAAGPEIVVNTQAITMIMTFGNLMSRAYPELVARHNELALIAWARIAEQQLLTQLGALSTAITSRPQRLGAIREMLTRVSQASAALRNRHRMNDAVPLRCIMPVWFRDILRADLIMQHPGDGLEVFEVADARILGWFTNRNINVTWSLDGEAGQDYAGLTNGATPPDFADYPADLIWYLFPEGTFAFMDGGTLDLGLVRDSTLNAANDYQTFVESFENIVKFGHEAFRIRTPIVPTGQGSEDKNPFTVIDTTP